MKFAARPTDRSAGPGRVAPDSIAPDSIALDSMALNSMAPDSVLPDNVGPDVVSDQSADRRTRDRVARLILETGPLTAASLGQRLALSPAAVRRHLDALVADAVLVEVQPRPSARRGRGRPARTYALTDLGRSTFPHACDDLATTALRYLTETGGPQAVTAFADRRADLLAGALAGAIVPPTGAPPASPAELADVLTAAGYASTVEITATGVQVCQHHCPVAHVAAEFPQLCLAETRAFARVLGTHVQRLATIAHGDGVCTTHIPNSGQRISLSTSTAGTSTVGASTASTSTASTSTREHRP